MAITIIKYVDLINWSFGNVLGESLHYNPQYSLVKLSDILTFDEDKCQLDKNVYYQQVTLKINGNGLEKRRNGLKKGAEIRTRDQHFLRMDQLVLSRIDARNGAFALVSQDFDGTIVTKDFPTYRIDKQLIRPQFLLLILLSRPFLQLVSNCSKGTTKRQRVDIIMLMNQQIPVPSLTEQDTILSHYQEILGDMKNRKDKIQQKENEKEQFFVNSLGLKTNTQQGAIESARLLFVKYNSLTNWNVNMAIKGERSESEKYPTYTLSELREDILLCKRGYNPKYKEESSVRILNQKCVRWNYIDLQFTKGVDCTWAGDINEDYTTHEGDILINSTGEGTIGRSAVVDNNCIGLLYDSHILLLRIFQQRLNPFFLSLLINSKYGQKQIEELKSAKTTHQTELGVNNLAKMSILLPPIAEQETIVAQMQKINDEIANLKDVDGVRAMAQTYFEQQIYQA